MRQPISLGDKRPSSRMGGEIEFKCQSLPAAVTNLEFSAVLAGDRPEQMEGSAIIHARCIAIEMFSEEFASERANRAGLCECSIHLAVSKQREAMQIAGADRGPFIVNKHQFGMDMDWISAAIGP